MRIKFETLKSLDPAETMDIENHLSPHTITQQQSQQQQQHQTSSTPTHILVDQQSRHSSHHSNSPQPQQNTSPKTRGVDDSSDHLDVKPNIHQLMSGMSSRQNASPQGMGADDSSDQLDAKPNVHQIMSGNTNGITTNNHIQIHTQQQQHQQHQLNQHQMQQLQQQIEQQQKQQQQQQQQSFDQMNTATINIVASPSNNGIPIQILAHGQSLTQFNGFVVTTTDLVPNMNMMNAGNAVQMQQGNAR